MVVVSTLTAFRVLSLSSEIENDCSENEDRHMGWIDTSHRIIFTKMVMANNGKDRSIISESLQKWRPVNHRKT